jgi:1-hydroxycarotenoid 3,4-desaturase
MQLSITPDIAVKANRHGQHGGAVISTKRVIVIGAGMGGLAAAIDLAGQGLDVTVLERASAPGGKVREVMVGDRPVDAGPTVFTMRWVFDALFDAAGERLEDSLALKKATTLARHAWDGEQTLDLFADAARSADAIGAFAGANEAKGYLAFCAEARRMYQALERPFLQHGRRSTLGLLASVGLRRTLRLKPFELMWAELGKHMQDKRLRQMFGRYASVCGTSPFQAVATMMMVAHIEQDGVWFVEGGMQRVAEAMAALAIRRGATIRYDSHVSEVIVAQGRAAGVRLAGGDAIAADAVVLNGEPGALGAGLFGEPARAAGVPVVKFPQRSLSHNTWAAIAEPSGMPLLRHTVFFSSDPQTEFRLIGNGLLPTEPTTYVCAQDRANPDDPAPSGPERLLLSVNAPPNGDRRAFSQVEIDQCMQGINSLMQRCGVRMRLVERPVMSTPALYHRMFPGIGGAIYGAAALGGTASLKRPGSRTRLEGLHLAGGSTHPGPGMPLATLSGRLAASSVVQDLVQSRGLTGLFLTGAMPGGMLTP